MMMNQMPHLLSVLQAAEQEAETVLEVAAEVASGPAWYQLDTSAHAIALTVLVLLGLLVPASLLIISWLANRHNDDAPFKSEPYECGLRAVVGQPDERFSVKFYLIAMLFLVFDLEVAFLYPWAVQFNDGGWGMVGVLMVFLLMLEAGYLYLYRKGALDWDE